MIIRIKRVTLYCEPFMMEFKAEPGEDVHDVVFRHYTEILDEAEHNAICERVEDYEQA
jgi:hypothetical protein